MYGQSSFLIAGVLFVSMLIAIEIGYRIGRRGEHRASESSRNHVNVIQASLLGVLALLIGFTFSLSLQRYDSRSEAVVDEADAIGTTYLRAQLLAAPAAADVQELLREYLSVRIGAGAISLDRHAERAVLLGRANEILDELWQQAVLATSRDPGPATTGLFVQSLDELIDSYGRRDAALDRHVPELVLFLLYGTFLMTGTIVGYASGLAGHRASFVAYVMVALMVLLVFIIVDLDRPRRGLIEVSQQSLLDLSVSMGEPAAPDTSP